jgi:alkylation response protein AidB-like acyl-CoA dehydrogenase
VVDAMAQAGLFRMLAPASAGGLEAPPAELVESVEALARGDGAAGWLVAVCATAGLLTAYLPPDRAGELFADPTAIVGGVFAPRGRGVAVDGGGIEVTGRWPFASGCEHCAWLLGGVVVEGEPAPRLAVAPREEVTIHDTWHVAGLRATGSHDIEMDGVLIPAGRSASVFAGPPTAGGPLYAFPLFGLLAIAIAACGLGIARGALDSLMALAAAKTPSGATRPMAARATVQADVALAEGALRAARGGLLAAVDEAWEAAQADGSVSIAHRTALRVAATHAARTAADVTAQLLRLAGGSAIYDSVTLQRRWRDAVVAGQHMLVAPPTLELTGRLLLGVETDTAQL